MQKSSRLDQEENGVEPGIVDVISYIHFTVHSTCHIIPQVFMTNQKKKRKFLG